MRPAALLPGLCSCQNASRCLNTHKACQQSNIQNRQSLVRCQTCVCVQGREANTIIFSSSVSDPAMLSANEGFYASSQRALVAFSRASHRLVVVCSRQLLDYLPSRLPDNYTQMVLWRRLRALCELQGRVLGTGEQDGIPVQVFQGAAI